MCACACVCVWSRMKGTQIVVSDIIMGAAAAGGGQTDSHSTVSETRMTHAKSTTRKKEENEIKNEGMVSESMMIVHLSPVSLSSTLSMGMVLRQNEIV